MKVVNKFFTILVMIILLTGCTIKNENDMLIDENGKMNYEIIIAFDREFLRNVINMNNFNNDDLIEITDDVMEDFVMNDATMKVSYLDGLEKQEYIDNNYIGTRYIYKVDDIDTISDTKDVVVNLGNYQSTEKLVNQKLFTKSSYQYSANFIFDLQSNASYEGVNYITKFKLTLPGKAIKHNATEVSGDGRTLTWDLSNTTNEVNFSFSLKGNKINFIVCIISIIFVLVTTLAILINRKEVNK
ncbi:MAG: hypothetical protein PUA90_01960 [bacterium]|nr:hypothetical protein [bacterium]